MKPTVLTFLLVFAVALPGPAAEVERTQGRATVRLEADELSDGKLVVPLSGKLRLTVTVEGPPLPADPYQPLRLSREWEVKPVSEPRTKDLGGGKSRWTQSFVLDPRGKTGSLTLALEPLKVGDDEVKWTDLPPVEVTTVVDKAELREARDVRPPEAAPPLPAPTWPLWVGVVVGLMTLVGLAVGAREVRRRFRTRVPPLQPHEWALRELQRLEALNLPAAGELNRFHSLLSEVVRRYLELRFQLPASRRTTSEFVQTVRKAEVLTEEQQQLLRELFEHCDLAKFAPVFFSTEEAQNAIQLARRFVEETRPKPGDGRNSPHPHQAREPQSPDVPAE